MDVLAFVVYLLIRVPSHKSKVVAFQFIRGDDQGIELPATGLGFGNLIGNLYQRFNLCPLFCDEVNLFVAGSMIIEQFILF